MTYSQGHLITKINRNTNDVAQFLYHELNKTEDTIVLKAERKIDGASVISHKKESTRYVSIDNKIIKIPMYHFPEGRYTVAVYTEDDIVAFDFERIRFIVRPDGATDDLELSVLQASLDEEELKNRKIRTRGQHDPKALSRAERIKRAREQYQFKSDRNRSAISDTIKKSNNVDTGYNLSRIPSRKEERTNAREEYRRTHLRPNGQPY